LAVIPTVSVALTRFQLASTALTVTLKLVKALCAVGVPVLPVALPAEAVSPGTSNCSFTNGPALTVMAGLVLAVLVPSVISVAVPVRLRVVLLVRVKLCVPLTGAGLAGSTSLGWVRVRPRVWLGETTFQLASTGLPVPL